MKNFLAVFIGKEEAMKSWNQLSDAEKKTRGQKGMAAWQKWVKDHEKAIVFGGSPLGRTKKISAQGVSYFKNELCAYTIVQAKDHNSAAEMFLNHPHFTLFPGDSIELLECMPVPGEAK